MFPGNFFAQFCLGLGLAFTLKRVENWHIICIKLLSLKRKIKGKKKTSDLKTVFFLTWGTKL